MQRVLGSIRDKALSPDELARVIGERAWEDTKREERAEGKAEGVNEGLVKGLRVAIANLCEMLGVDLSEERQQHLAALDLDGVEALRRDLKEKNAWPR
jgi:hypothetical protein